MIRTIALVLLLFAAAPAGAQELLLDEVTFVKAEVVEVLSAEVREVPGTGTHTTLQSIRAKILEGDRVGDTVVIENDYFALEKGDVFYARHTREATTGREYYAVSDPYRLDTLFILAALFLLCLFVFGGWQGVRGLLALAASFGAIGYLLLPGILSGYSPVLVALVVSSVIIVVGSYITHGVNRTTSAAVLGMVATVACTGVLAYWAVDAAQLTGYADEEAVYLNFDTGGSLDFIGLLLAGLVIGLLGVLYDAAISQAIAVEELLRAAAHYSRREVFSRALRIGREHIGALVNTLAIAYVGASLPLVLLLVHSSTTPMLFINQELLATEIVRTLVGSIGLILAVPITTGIAVWMLHGKKQFSTTEGHGHRH